MKPTVDDVLAGRAQWCVLQGDNAKLLPTFGKRSVHHVITDPPYAAKLMSNIGKACIQYRREGKVRTIGYAGLTDAQRTFSAEQFARLACRWILVWTDIESDEAWRANFRQAKTKTRYVRTGAWVRLNGAPQFSGDRPAQGLEACVIQHAADRMHWNGGGHPAVWAHPIVNSNDSTGTREHSTPKPLSLMLEQVEQFTDPGDVVLDPFCGSGTTGVACLRLGRRFVGIELNKTYAKLSRDRLAAETRGLSLRDARAGQTSLFDLVAGNA